MRRVYYFRDKPDWPSYLIHYLGNEAVYKERTHGNSRSNRNPYIITSNSVLNGVKDTVRQTGSGKSVMKVYAESQADVNIHAVHQGVLNPKGSKQVRNQVYNERKKLRISKDEMHSTVLVAHQLDDYVRNYTLDPDFECVIGYTEILDELNTLVSLQTEEPVLMGYDTTFNASNNFVSTLVFKHVMFEGANFIPAAFLIHDRNKQSCHKLFF